MSKRERLSATVESELLTAGRHAVAEGRAESLSAWVNDALARQTEHDKKLRAMREFLRDYQDEFGQFTQQEIQEITRRTRDRAIRVRPKPTRRAAARAQRRKRGAA
jgi:tellurite resistance protein